MACILVYVLKIGQLLYCGLVDYSRGAHRIYVLELFLKCVPGFLWAFALNNRLMLIGDDFREYPSCFAHGQVVFFFVMH